MKDARCPVANISKLSEASFGKCTASQTCFERSLRTSAVSPVVRGWDSDRNGVRVLNAGLAVPCVKDGPLPSNKEWKVCGILDVPFMVLLMWVSIQS